MKFVFVIFAGGLGKRMSLTKHKPLTKIFSCSFLEIILKKLEEVSLQLRIISDVIIVSSNELSTNDEYIKILNDSEKKLRLIKIKSIIQKEKNGTGGALKCALEFINFNKLNYEKLIAWYSDTPFVLINSVKKFLESESDCIVGAFEDKNENNYGAIIFNEMNFENKNIQFNKIENINSKSQSNKPKEIISALEFKNNYCQNDNKLSDPNIKFSKKNKICNSGIYGFKVNFLNENIDKLKINENNEFFLTDLVKISNDNNYNNEVIILENFEGIGINSKKELNSINIQKVLREDFLNSSNAIFHDINSVFFSFKTVIGDDSEIYPFVVFSGDVKIGKNVTIFPFTFIENSVISDGAKIGPFARLRKNVSIGENSEIGNFVEIKESLIGKKTKAKHLAYIGNSEIGDEVNFGAGAITCNYDGIEKHETKIGRRVMIGANSSLIAPLIINNDSYIAAGSTVTDDIPKNSLVIARAKMEIKYKNKKD